MTKLHMSIILAFAVPLLPVFGEDWTTTDGKTYQGVKVVKIEADCVTILDSDGGARIELAKLPPDLQKRFNYDPDKAKAAAQKREDDQNKSQGVVPANDNPSEPPRDSSGQILTPDKVALEGFLEIHWGSNSEEAKKTMSEKGFTFVGVGKPDQLVFSGGSFANEPVQSVTLSFFKDQLFEAEVDFPKTDDDDKTFATLTDAYTRKYGVRYTPQPDTAIWECKDGNDIILINSNGVGVVYSNKSLSDKSHAEDVSKVKSTDL